MSEYALLKVGKGSSEKKFSVMDCHCHFSRNYNHAEPDGNARCDRLNLLLNNVDAADLTLYKWFVNKETKSGSVEFFRDDDYKIKEIKFETARCFSFTEDYENLGKYNTRRINISLVAESITSSGVDFKEI